MRLVVFDLDGTLFTGDSDYEWMAFLAETGVLDRVEAERANRDTMARDLAGTISPADFCRFYVALLKDHSREQLDRWRRVFMRTHVLPRLRPRGRTLVAKHRDAGDLLVLSTATNRFLTTPIAAELGFEHLIATEPAMREDRYTGDFTGIPNMHEGKVARLEAWLAARGAHWHDFAETWYYGDSHNDIPLLSRVSHPVAVDPDKALAAHARARGWPIISLA